MTNNKDIPNKTESDPNAEIEPLKKERNTPLSDKQKKWADEYFNTQDGRQAALKAGYSANNASVEASRLKKNTKVRCYLEQKAQSAFEDKNLNLVDINKELTKRSTAERETLNHFLAIKDPKNATKFKYWELYLFLKGHKSENKTQNLFISTEGRGLTHLEIMEEAERIMRKVHTHKQAIEVKPINNNDD